MIQEIGEYERKQIRDQMRKVIYHTQAKQIAECLETLFVIADG